MTQKYDWDAIRDRYESGETAGAISKSLGGSPTRQGIQKRANREGWLKISVDARQAVRNLPSIQNPTFPRAPSDELGHRSQKNAQRILSALERGASPKIAAKAVGLSEDQLKAWMNDDRQFSMEIGARAAQNAGENLWKIMNTKDWHARKWLLEHSPFSREEYGSQQSNNEGPTIILNIHRDEVVIEQPPIDVTPDIESSQTLESAEEPETKRPGDVDVPQKEATETATESQAEPPQSRSIIESPFPPRDPEGARERDRLEKERTENCWQGENVSEKKALSEQQALEQRVMGLSNK